VNRVLLQDLAWALLIGAMVGVSSHLPGYRLVVEIVGGVAAGALVLCYRVVSRRRSGETAARRGGHPPAISTPPAAIWAVLLLFCAIFAPAAVWMYGEWTESIWRNGHGLFIPLIMFLLARSILRRDTGEGDGASPWGFFFVSAGLLLAVVGSAIPFHILSALGLALCLPGLSLLLFGVRRTRALAPPLWLGLLMVPLPTSLAPYVYLPLASAAGAELMFGLLEIPVVRQASALMMSDVTWFVSDRCSGFSALVAAAGASVFLAVYSKSCLRRIALLLSPWFLVVIFNSLRTFGIAAFFEYTGISLLDVHMHGAPGIATFWAVLGVLFLMADWRTLRETFS
jgi:exosortase